MQAGKQLRGMLNGFSVPPCGSTRGQRRDLGCRRRQLPGTGTGSQRKVAQPFHKPVYLLFVTGAWRMVWGSCKNFGSGQELRFPLECL